MEKAEKIKILISFVFAIIFFAVLPASASAATLYFSPSSGEYAVGKTLSISVYVSSADQAMNAASGIILFPKDKLEAVSLSKSGSIFTLWVQEPQFSNHGAGTVNFEGIALNPGFTGASGKLITINLKAKTAGVALLNFSSGSVLSNDGKGTNILTSLGNAQFNFKNEAPAIPEPKAVSDVSAVPSVPQISSPTHPDTNKWYAQKDAKFVWTLPARVTDVRLLTNNIPDTVPTEAYTPAISEREITISADGIWYFHLQFRNASGWGEISHFRFQIDTEPPEPFAIKFVGGNKTENPMPQAVFDATDSLSGLDYYKIKIGGGEFFSIEPETVKNNPYTLPLQNPGKRSIFIQAFDSAGNYSVAAEEFIIEPLQAPVLTEYPQKPQSEEFLIIRVLMYTNLMTLLFLLIALIFIFWRGRRKSSLLRKRLQKEAREAKYALRKTLNLLKENIEEQIKLLEQTDEKEKIIQQLSKGLTDAEKIVRKKIEDIENAAQGK